VTRPAPEVSDEHLTLTRAMFDHCMAKGWYLGDMQSLMRTRAHEIVEGATTPELKVILQLSRDRMHHSVGWWRNAEYEYCWHLSMSCTERLEFAAWEARGSPSTDPPQMEVIPDEERRYWARAVFREEWDKLWIEPGGTDPRLSMEERIRHARYVHMRLFLDPETFQPFIPQGEVYDMTRWIPGLTPEKVDR
jgi:hypothetical protein